MRGSALAALVGWLCVALAPIEARSEALAERVEGRWGLPGIASCAENASTLRFSEDGKTLFQSYRRPLESVLGREQFFQYEVIGFAGTAIRMRLGGEHRKDESGELVFWDLILLHPDRLCWHRSDWEVGGCTPVEHRCESESNALVDLLRSATAQAVYLLSNGDFETTSEMFELPDGLEQSELLRERSRISKSLRIVVEELGAPSNPLEADQNPTGGGGVPALHEITVSGLAQTVAQERSQWRPLLYSVEYGRLGPGYFRLDLTDSGGIVGASFSLGEEERQRIAEIGERLLREAAP